LTRILNKGLPPMSKPSNKIAAGTLRGYQCGHHFPTMDSQAPARSCREMSFEFGFAYSDFRLGVLHFPQAITGCTRRGCRRSFVWLRDRRHRTSLMKTPPNKSLQTIPKNSIGTFSSLDGRSCFPTASGFTLVGTACLSSGL